MACALRNASAARAGTSGKRERGDHADGLMDHDVLRAGACGHLAAVDALPFRGVPFKGAGQALHLDPGFRQGLIEFQCDGVRDVVLAFAQQAAAWRTVAASSARSGPTWRNVLSMEWPSR